jgi:hypothetical protein
VPAAVSVGPESLSASRSRGVESSRAGSLLGARQSDKADRC